jgi:hypothetical protein
MSIWTPLHWKRSIAYWKTGQRNRRKPKKHNKYKPVILNLQNNRREDNHQVYFALRGFLAKCDYILRKIHQPGSGPGNQPAESGDVRQLATRTALLRYDTADNENSGETS